jgi:hypothetical protein
MIKNLAEGICYLCYSIILAFWALALTWMVVSSLVDAIRHIG